MNIRDWLLVFIKLSIKNRLMWAMFLVWLLLLGDPGNLNKGRSAMFPAHWPLIVSNIFSVQKDGVQFVVWNHKLTFLNLTCTYTYTYMPPTVTCLIICNLGTVCKIWKWRLYGVRLRTEECRFGPGVAHVSIESYEVEVY